MNPDEFTRPATWDDVVNVVNLLKKYDVDYCLVGGYALAAHELVRPTLDIDIAVSPNIENSKRWILALSNLPDKATEELMSLDDPFEGDTLHAIRINDEFTIDIMPSVAGIPYHDLKNNIQTKIINNTEIPVLDLYGLLMTKQSVRLKDRADAQWIESAIKTYENTFSNNEMQLISSVHNFIEECNRVGNVNKVSRSVSMALTKAFDQCKRQSKESRINDLLSYKFGNRAKEIIKYIQREQDNSL